MFVSTVEVNIIDRKMLNCHRQAPKGGVCQSETSSESLKKPN